MSNGTRLTNEEALDRILKKCKEKNIEFLGEKVYNTKDEIIKEILNENG